MKFPRILGLMCVSVALFATEPDALVSTPPDMLAQIEADYNQLDFAYRKAVAELAGTSDEKPKSLEYRKSFSQKQTLLFAAALDLAKKQRKSEIGFAALEWFLSKTSAYYQPFSAEGINLLIQDYATNPRITALLTVPSYYLPYEDEDAYIPVIKLLRTVAAQNPDRGARGQALLGLAWLAKRQYHQAHNLGKPESERLAQEAIQALELVEREYATCPNLRTLGVRAPTSTLGEELEGDLKEMRSLRPGLPAPLTEGQTLLGTSLSTKEYKGKVVLLVFWAAWCKACIKEVPAEKLLVERFKNRPFVLLGVNGDSEKSTAIKAVEQYQIPWTSLWNGPEGPGGPIALDWNVRSWPTLYLIDHRGIIRYRSLHDKDLADALERLISEAEKH